MPELKPADLDELANTSFGQALNHDNIALWLYYSTTKPFSYAGLREQPLPDIANATLLDYAKAIASRWDDQAVIVKTIISEIAMANAAALLNTKDRSEIRNLAALIRRQLESAPLIELLRRRDIPPNPAQNAAYQGLNPNPPFNLPQTGPLAIEARYLTGGRHAIDIAEIDATLESANAFCRAIIIKDPSERFRKGENLAVKLMDAMPKNIHLAQMIAFSRQLHDQIAPHPRPPEYRTDRYPVDDFKAGAVYVVTHAAGLTDWKNHQGVIVLLERLVNEIASRHSWKPSLVAVGARSPDILIQRSTTTPLDVIELYEKSVEPFKTMIKTAKDDFKSRTGARLAVFDLPNDKPHLRIYP